MTFEFYANQPDDRNEQLHIEDRSDKKERVEVPALSLPARTRSGAAISIAHPNDGNTDEYIGQ